MSKTTQATVRILISHDYCHFEISKTIQPDNVLLQKQDGQMEMIDFLTQEEIDNARKDCQRLADKAVGQYKTAKAEATKMTNSSYELAAMKREVEQINKKREEEWSVFDKAKVKALEDYNHTSKYNYMDDEDYMIEEYEIGNE